MKNILFLTLLDIKNNREHNIYCDVMAELAKNGNNVYIASPVERKYGKKTYIVEDENCNDWHKNIRILKVRIGNIFKTNIIEKGISTVLLEGKYKSAIKKYFKGVKFDVVLYSTPPITFAKPIRYVKKRDNTRTYLMLKDIFPQNAVDLGMLSKSGLKGIIYKYFRKKEKKLYAISDKIGCMSKANVEYVLNNNPEISTDKVEVFPNCLEVNELCASKSEKEELRKKYNLPLDKKIFIYGGNLGKPQGVPFIIDCLKKEKDNGDVAFLIIGSGTEFDKLKTYKEQSNQPNFILMENMERNEYDKLASSCDVGLIFLDHRFTIPNFPSRLLSYMQAGLPVLACTDKNTDIGKIIVDGGFGWWCESNDADGFSVLIKQALTSDLSDMAEKELKFLMENYSVKNNIQKLL